MPNETNEMLLRGTKIDLMKDPKATQYIRVPVHMIGLIEKLRTTQFLFWQTHQEIPTEEYIAKHMDLVADEVYMIKKHSENIVAFERIVNEKILLHKAELEKQLPDTDYRAMRVRFGLDNNTPEPLENTARIVGIDRSQIRTIEHTVLESRGIDQRGYMY